MLQLWLDGRWLYVTDWLSSTRDNQFYIAPPQSAAREREAEPGGEACGPGADVRI
jgi:hypothetical protein